MPLKPDLLFQAHEAEQLTKTKQKTAIPVAFAKNLRSHFGGTDFWRTMMTKTEVTSQIDEEGTN